MKTDTLRQWLWRAFVFWTALEAILTFTEFGPAQISRWVSWTPLQQALIGFTEVSISIWIVLGAAFTYFYLIQQEGLGPARRVSLCVLAFSFAAEVVGLRTGQPFGPYIYTAKLSSRILGVPFTIPLVWLIMVCSCRYTILHFLHHAKRWQIAVGSGVLAMGSDIGLEWLAWRIWAYRLWYFPAANTPKWPPLQNYFAWFAITALLTWVAFPRERPVGRHQQPLILLVTINLLCWLTIAFRLASTN